MKENFTKMLKYVDDSNIEWTQSMGSCERAPDGVVETGGEQVPPSDGREVSGLDDTMMRERLQRLVLGALHLS